MIPSSASGGCLRRRLRRVKKYDKDLQIILRFMDIMGRGHLPWKSKSLDICYIKRCDRVIEEVLLKLNVSSFLLTWDKNLGSHTG